MRVSERVRKIKNTTKESTDDYVYYTIQSITKAINNRTS